MILRAFVISCFLARGLHAQTARPDTVPADTAHPAAHAHAHDDADDEHARGGHHEHEGLHFSHPIVTESVSPDTKVRVDFAQSDPDRERELQVEGEYAFTRAFSVEAGVAHGLEQGSGGEAELSLKAANYHWEELGILVGGGVSVGVPLRAGTAVGEESDAAELQPFVNAGIRRGGWELTGAAQLGFLPADADAGARLGWNAAALYHLSERVEPMLEYQGAGGLSGAARGETSHAVAPGIKVRPFAPLMHVGASLLIPVGGQREFDTRVLVSAFYHF
jgi:hypothetical protein